MQGKCESPTDPKYGGASPCGTNQVCCAVDLGCSRGTATWLYERTCTVESQCNSVVSSDGKTYKLDPFFMPANYTA